MLGVTEQLIVGAPVMKPSTLGRQYVLFELRGKVAFITLNSEENRNALGVPMCTALEETLASIRSDDRVGAVVLTGAGKSFCSGGDVSAMSETNGIPPSAMRARMRAIHNRITELIALEKPVVAAVNGVAAGAGASLALACDFVFAAPTTRFIMSFGRMGLVPDYAAMYLLPRIVGLQKAKDLIFTARAVPAEEAEEIGMVYRIVASESLVSDAGSFAARIADSSSVAVGLAKSILNRSFNLDLQSVLEMEAMAQAIAKATDYHREATRRFLAKEKTMYHWESDAS